MRFIIKADTEYEAGGKTFDGYMGAVGWEGKNSKENLDITQIAKIVKSQFKKKFPGYKISAKTSRFSGGEDITVMVWLHKSDLMPKDKFVAEAANNPWQFLGGSYWIGAPDENGAWKDYRTDELTNWDKNQLTDFFSRYYDYQINYYGSGDKYHRMHYGYEAIPVLNDEPLKYVKGLVDSFNWDDSNSMVDYFSTNFYSFIEYAYD